MKTLIAMTWLLSAAFGQTLPVVDESPADSPLHFSGYNGNNQCVVNGRNSGSSTIVAWVAELHGVKALYVEDLFFYDEHTYPLARARKPGLEDGMYDVERDRYVFPGTLCFAFNHLLHTEEPSMRIKVRAVQFEDDSVWGDRAAIKELAFRRQDTINYLQSLQSSANLNKALAEAPYPNLIKWDRIEAPFQYAGTREEIVTEIEKRLAHAKQHQAWMTALK